MHFCEQELQGMVLEPCGRPASVKHDGEWFCEFHYDALLAMEVRWAGLIRAADRCEPYEFTDSEDGDGFEDD
jgi:hypothetical protein